MMNLPFKAVLRMALLCFILFFTTVIVLMIWAWSGRGDTSDVLECEIRRLSGADTAVLPPDHSVGVITWNIAYGRGPAGDESGPWSREFIESQLNGIADTIIGTGADIVALQEVDLGASRSHGIDESEYLATRLGWPYFACVVTWQQNYIPFPYWPPSRHFGRMKSGQCVLSRYPIEINTRYRLPQPAANPFWYNAFYLHRAHQHLVVDVGGTKIDVWNIHLEAFDQPNRQRQMETLLEWVDETAGSATLVLGDFNSLPADAKMRHGFVDEPEADFRGDDTVSGLSDRSVFVEAFARVGDAGGERFTFPADAPTRRLDYLFTGGNLESLEAEILHDAVFSDHLAVFSKIRLREAVSGGED